MKMKRLLLLSAIAIVTIVVALLLIPGEEWTVALVLCLCFILLGETAIVFAPELLSQPARAMLPWNVGMSAVPLVYIAVAAGLFVFALGGLEWRIVLSVHLVTLLLLGAVIAAVRSGGQCVLQTQQADDHGYDDLTRLRTRVGVMLDRLSALSLDDANTVEREARDFHERLRYAVPAVGADAATGPSVLLDAVQQMESAVDAMQRGDDRPSNLLDLRSQIKLADAVLRRHRGALTQIDL